MTYQEFMDKINPLYAENEAKFKNATATETFNLNAAVSDDDMDKMRTTGGCLNNPANLKFCTFNMDNETVKWTGHTNDAPLAVKYGFIQYAYDTIKTMNYGLRNMIGTISEGYARKKYIARIEQGGSQFTEIVKDLMI